jgi:hypothetical protein
MHGPPQFNEVVTSVAIWAYDLDAVSLVVAILNSASLRRATLIREAY